MNYRRLFFAAGCLSIFVIPGCISGLADDEERLASARQATEAAGGSSPESEPKDQDKTNSEADSAFAASRRHIASGGGHTCFIAGEGSVYCWGRNDRGQCGDGTTAYRNTAAKVPGIDDAISIAAGELHTCAQRKNGSVLCWGDNSAYQLGIQLDKLYAETPATILGEGKASAVAAGGRHTCIIGSGDGHHVQCWGANQRGQAGAPSPGTVKLLTEPIYVGGSQPISAKAIACGGAHTCAVLSSGGGVCWGDNLRGQLGCDQHMDHSDSPVVVKDGNSFVSMSLGAYHSCAADAQHKAYCWGANQDGQLGDGTYVNSFAPIGVDLAAPVKKLGTGAYHGCALLSTGHAACWGLALDGQLGTTMPYVSVGTPVPVTVTNVGQDDICGGIDTSCSMSNGSPVCWGATTGGYAGQQPNVFSPYGVYLP